MIAGIVTLSAGIGVVIVVICFRRKFSSNIKITFFWKKKSPIHQAVQTILRYHRALAFRRYSYSDIKKITNFFRDKLVKEVMVASTRDNYKMDVLWQ